MQTRMDTDEHRFVSALAVFICGFTSDYFEHALRDSAFVRKRIHDRVRVEYFQIESVEIFRQVSIGFIEEKYVDEVAIHRRDRARRNFVAEIAKHIRGWPFQRFAADDRRDRDDRRL